MRKPIVEKNKIIFETDDYGFKVLKIKKGTKLGLMGEVLRDIEIDISDYMGGKLNYPLNIKEK